MQIEVTQFMMPNGTQVLQTIDVDDDCSTGYEAVKKAGCRLTAEMLSDYNTVSLCIEHPVAGDFDIAIIPNGPRVKKALEVMLARFRTDKFQEWMENK